MTGTRRSFGPFALGLTLALGVLAGPACKRDSEQAAGAEHRALRTDQELLVAPVLDAHPWVIALVTEISITRPEGADARLEGRLHHQGLRHPEPIIEGESREALERALAAYEGKFPRDPAIVPVWEADPFGPDERVRWRLYFADRGRGFVLDDQARATLQRHDHGPSVHLHLGQAQRERLHALTREIETHRLAVALDGEALMLPVVMEPIPSGEIQLLTRTSEDPEQTAPALLARLTGS